MSHPRTINNLSLKVKLLTYNKNNDEISTNAMIGAGAVLEYMSDSFRKKQFEQFTNTTTKH